MIRCLFVIGFIGLLVGLALRGQWEAQLHITDAEIYISDLPVAPVWQPPAEPLYDQFTEVFDSLPAEKAASWTVSVELRWDWMAIEFLLWFWLMASLIGVLYLMARGACVDTLLEFVLHIAIGLTIRAGACLGFWFLNE